MEEKLDFSLPNKKQKEPLLRLLLKAVSNALLVLLIFLLIGNLLRDYQGQETSSKKMHSGLSAEQTRDLATKLAQRNLYQQAAHVWQQYLSEKKLSHTEQANLLFQVGRLYEKAGLYAQAIEFFYRSETVAKLDKLSSEINSHIKSCFEKLGKFSALRYEIVDRTSLKAAEAAGGKIVAEIGAEKITEADLDARIEKSIENQIAPIKSFMTAEQLNQQKKQMMEQYRSPQAKQQFLQSWLAQEILYRQALELNLQDQSETKRFVDEIVRGALANQLMSQQLATKINITETDLQTYYTANKNQYVEPDKAHISHILLDDKQQALELIEQAEEGEDFAGLAKQFSKDMDTSEKGGRIEVDIVKGSDVPGLEDANELNEKIFAANAPAVLAEPFETEKGWEVIKVDQIQLAQQKSFEQVKQQVMFDLSQQKRQEVQQELISQMMDKYEVIIHNSALGANQQVESESEFEIP